MEIRELIKFKKRNKKNISKPYRNKCNFIITFISILIFLLSFFINIYFFIYISKSDIKFQKLFEKIENKLSETNNKQEPPILKTNTTNEEYSIKLLKMMTNNDEKEYKGALNCLLNDNEFCIYRLLCPKEIPGKKRILIGRKADGGYVLLDDFENIKIAYSFGIEADAYFDKDLADRGIDVYMYDHTINNLPFENPKFHWKKIGVGGKNDTNENIDRDLHFINIKIFFVTLSTFHFEILGNDFKYVPLINIIDILTFYVFHFKIFAMNPKKCYS